MPIRLRNKDYHFRPSWTITVLALVLMALFVSLGVWQLKRSTEKRDLLHAYDQRMQQAPQPLMLTQPFRRYQHVQVTGDYLSSIFLLDNRQHDGQVGYEVLNVFQLTPSKKLLLINRGWVPANQNRQIKPVISVPTGELDLSGLIYFPTKKAFTLGDYPETSWPKRIQRLDFQQMSNELGHPLLPVVLLLDPSLPHGFVRDWQPVVATSPYKHIGYASQWFLFALILLILYIILNFKPLRDSL